jgi:Fe2+ transport system protein FeoA
MHNSKKSRQSIEDLKSGSSRNRFSKDAQAALDTTGSPAAQSKSGSQPGSLYRVALSLADLRPGECGNVHHLIGTTQGRLRLLEMGLTPGTHVKVVRAAAFGGPLDIQLRGYQLSLRRDEASAVWLDDPDGEK